MKNLIKCLASFFYLGYLPGISGTVGSLAGLILCLLFKDNLPAYSLLLFLVTVIGFLIARPAEEAFGEQDSGKIVIDEVAGMLLAFWVVKLNLTLLITGFLLFRLLDIFKAPPARRLEQIGGGRGVMLDDLLAGVYTNIVLQIMARL